MSRHVSKAGGSLCCQPSSLRPQEWAELCGHGYWGGSRDGEGEAASGRKGRCSGCWWLWHRVLARTTSDLRGGHHLRRLFSRTDSVAKRKLRGFSETVTLRSHGPGRWASPRAPLVPARADGERRSMSLFQSWQKPHPAMGVSLGPHVAPRKVTVSSTLAVT